MKRFALLLLWTTSQVLCQQKTPESYFERFALEIFMAALLAVLFWNFVKGKQHNEMIFNGFLKPQIPFLSKHFQYFGPNLIDGEILNAQPDMFKDVVEHEKPYFFKLFLTGRVNCRYALLSVVTKRRQDFLVSIFYGLLYPEKDRFYLEISLADMPVPKGIFYLVKARQAKKLLEEFEDMRTLCTKYTASGLSGTNMMAYAEHPDLPAYLLDPSVMDVLVASSAEIETIEISDCVQSEINRGVTIKLHGLLVSSKDKNEERAKNILALALRLADKYAEYVPPKKIVEKLQENRKEFYAQKNKEKIRDALNESAAKKWESMSEEEKQRRKQIEEKRARKKSSRQIVISKS